MAQTDAETHALRCVAVRTIGTNVSVIPLSILTLSKFGGASAVNKQVFHCSWLARTFNFQFPKPYAYLRGKPRSMPSKVMAPRMMG